MRLDGEENEARRRKAMEERCSSYRSALQQRNPFDVANKAALSAEAGPGDDVALRGEHLMKSYTVHWPQVIVLDKGDNRIEGRIEALWLHYLHRADGTPLAGRWVNLSEIGGLFYQQAFQGYCGDELATFWQDDLENLERVCRQQGGWPRPGPGDFSCEWRILPRVPLLLSYRLPMGDNPAWATMLFDAATNHYIAADVAAIFAKELADKLMERDT